MRDKKAQLALRLVYTEKYLAVRKHVTSKESRIFSSFFCTCDWNSYLPLDSPTGFKIQMFGILLSTHAVSTAMKAVAKCVYS